MFCGEFEHTIDAKGRMFVPASFREQLVGKIYITYTDLKCVKLYSKPEWEKFCERVNQLPPREFEDFSRYLFRRTLETELDSSGRLLIPEKYRQHANLDKTVLVIGRNNLIEIWNETELNKLVIERENESALIKGANDGGVAT